MPTLLTHSQFMQAQCLAIFSDWLIDSPDCGLSIDDYAIIWVAMYSEMFRHAEQERIRK